ncbi:thiamine biosynthesis protein ApbE [Brucella suis 1330]|nr:thiamine biosynthesis protein ApbE [Brucella suis 1330]
MGIASGIGPAQASISSRGCGTLTSGALASSCTGAGGTGHTIELVVSADGCGWSMMLSMPELDVQPVKAAARAMAVTSEKRMGTVTQNKGLQCSA